LTEVIVMLLFIVPNISTRCFKR